MIKNVRKAEVKGAGRAEEHKKADCPKQNGNRSSENFKTQICLNCGGRHATTSCFKLKNRGGNNVSGFVGTKRSEIRAETNDHWKFVIPIFVNRVRCAAVR